MLTGTDRKPKSTTPIVPPASGDYRPPEDFTRISKKDVPSSNPFSATNLEGKEIWYITAPANVSLSALASVNPVDVAEGNPVMEVDGRSYCLRPDEDANTDESGVGLLVADSTGQYRAGMTSLLRNRRIMLTAKTAKKPIAKKFAIVETLGRSYTIPNDHVPKPKPVREQPKGLKQRFTPIGADLVRSDVAEADKMDIDEPAEPAVKAEGKMKKHKSSHGDESGEKRKKKKSKKEAVP